jgi:hypothetical protein
LIKIIIIFYSLLAIVRNTFYFIEYLFSRSKIRKLTSRRLDVSNKFESQKVLLILNGPSANQIILDDYNDFCVAVVNKFFLIEKLDHIKPDLYFISDPQTIMELNNESLFSESIAKFSNTSFITNFYKDNTLKVANRRLYFTYSRLHPISSNLDSNPTGLGFNFYNVSLYAIHNLILMGFKEIHIAGLDFNLSFNHAYQEERGLHNNDKNSMYDDLNAYLNYFLAHYESYLVSDYAKHKFTKIVNLNPNSQIKAYDFKNS